MDPLFDIVAFGEPMVEFNQTGEGSGRHYLQGFGGDTSNFAIAAARQGARVACASALGPDPYGQMLRDLWAREGIDDRWVATDPQAFTAIYFVTHDAAGHHFHFFRAGSAASRVSAQGVAIEAAQSARVLHLSGISLAISASACDTAFAAMQVARAAGTRVALDSNLRLSLWPLARAQACITHAIGLCDLFLPSLEDITALTGLTDPQAIIAWSHAQGAQQVVLKLGAEGALASDGQTQRRVPGLTVAAVDATGAGDCFAGNLLARLSLSDDLWTATAYANAAAALSVQGYGAVAPLPRRDAVLQSLQP